MPAVEYNVFHYSEATRRCLAFQFGHGHGLVRVQRHDDLRQAPARRSRCSSRRPNYATQQPWGESEIQLEHRGYLNDPSKRSTQLSGDIERAGCFRGFSVRFGGEYSWIHDQVYLAEGGARPGGRAAAAPGVADGL